MKFHAISILLIAGGLAGCGLSDERPADGAMRLGLMNLDTASADRVVVVLTRGERQARLESRLEDLDAEQAMLIEGVRPGIYELELHTRRGTSDNPVQLARASAVEVRAKATAELALELRCAAGADCCIPTDRDGDGVSECAGDCDDSDAAVFPGASERCNNRDDDCDALIDEDGSDSLRLARPCFTSEVSQRGQGACADGVSECVGGLWERACVGETRPWPRFAQTEREGADQDCNGVADSDEEAVIGCVECPGGLLTVSVDERYDIIVGLRVPGDAPEGGDAREAVAAAIRQALIDEVNTTVGHERALVEHEHFDLLFTFTGNARGEAIIALLRDARVRSVIRDFKLHASQAESPSAIDAPEFWTQSGTQGDGTTVAVLDSGADYTHPALGGCVAPGPDCRIRAGEDFVENDGDPADGDPNGHGTASAAAIATVAPNARIVALRVMNQNGEVEAAALLAALSWLQQNHSTFGITTVLFGFAEGLYSQPEICDAFASALGLGSLVDLTLVAPAGNDGSYTHIAFPACASDVLSVGAFYDGEEAAVPSRCSSPPCPSGAAVDGEVAHFSNSSPFLDLLAPGADVLVAAPGGGSQMVEGTSVAAAHAAGAAALLQGHFLTNGLAIGDEEVRDRLVLSGVPTFDPGPAAIFPALSMLRCLESLDCVDADGDGIGRGLRRVALTGPAICPAEDWDCDDTDPEVRPGFAEDCDDARDLNCSGVPDEGCGQCVGKADGTACELDGLACTQEACALEQCESVGPLDCSALDNACATGVCNEAAAGCVAVPKAAGLSCSDGAFCNGDEVCDGAGGCAAPSVACTVPCQETCDEDSDSCLPSMDPAGCEDGSACTVESCDNGQCVTEPLGCEALDGCTIHYCDPGFGCDFHEIFCDDGDPCTDDICNMDESCSYVSNGSCDPPPFADEFDDAASLADWKIRSVEEGDDTLHELIDIDDSTEGHMVIVPNDFRDPAFGDGGQNPAWFEDRKGPFVYKDVAAGDFLVWTRVRVVRQMLPEFPPSGSFHAGGLLVRSPDSYDGVDSDTLGNERWVTVNLGRQNNGLGTEVKTTFPDGDDGGPASDSTLFINPADEAEGELAICRVGNVFRMLRRIGDGPWEETVEDGSTVLVDQNGLAPNFAAGFDRPDLAGEVQVGMMANRWQDADSGGPRAEFDWVRFRVPTGLADCVPDGPVASPTPEPTPEPTPTPAMTPEPTPPVTPEPTPTPAPSGDAMDAHSDEFDDGSALGSKWRIRHIEESEPAHHDLMDIDQTTPGHLTLDANLYNDPALSDGGQGAAWFQDRRGPYVYQEVTGDFRAVLSLQVGTRTDIDQVPGGNFNAGGFVLRAPVDLAAQPQLGDERWVMFNIGNQAGSPAVETKTTFIDGPDGSPESDSSLFLTPISALSGQLVVCRVGDAMHFWRRLDGDGDWIAQTHTAENNFVDNASLAPDFDSGFVRPDFPETIQVGLMANRWTDGGTSPVRVIFDYVRFASVSGEADCLNGL